MSLPLIARRGIPLRQPFALVRTAAIAALLLSATGVQAVEEDDEDFNAIARKEHDPSHVNDWRFSYTMLPARADITIMDKADEGNPANYRRSTNWDLTGRTGLLWMTPWSGVGEDGDFIFGLELSTNHCVIEKSDVSPEIDMRTMQVTIHPGLSWLLDDNFHIEINPFLSLGQAQFEQSEAGDGSDLYFELGLRFGAYYTWRSGFQFGLQTGYLYGFTEGEISGGGATYDTEIKIQGIFLGAQIGYRL
jgi:hypothetical protein